MDWRKGVVIAGILMLSGAGRAEADGIVFPRPKYEVTETDQKAVLWYDGQTETMIVSINFSGNTDDFAWVIPVPGKPEVNEGVDELFTGLQQLTAPVTNQSYGSGGFLGLAQLSLKESPVTVVETKRVDIYDIAVLTAENTTALRGWLEDNGYEYPQSREYLLRSYVNKDWYFVAAKVTTEAVGYAGGQLKTGHATPLKIVFPTARMVYPLKISGKPADTITTPTPMPGATKEDVVGAWSWENGATQGWYSGQVIETAESFDGKYVMKMTGYRGVNQNTRNYIRKSVAGLKPGRYTFSAYVKPAAAASGYVKLSVGGMENESPVSNLEEITGWKRLELSFTASRNSYQLNLDSENMDGSVLWDGVQLETGDEATPFVKEIIAQEIPNFVIPTKVPDKPVNLVLYVFADHKQEVPGWKVEYAGRVSRTKIEKLAVDDEGEPWMKVSGGKYLTKLNRTMKLSEMTTDVYPRQSENDRSVGAGTRGIEWTGWRVLLVLVLPLVAEVVLIGYIWSRRK